MPALLKISAYLQKLNYVRIFIPLMLCILLLLLYGSRYKNAPFYIDEFHFIRKGFYFDLFFIKHDFSDLRWTVLEEPRQPKIGTYLYGLNLHLHGIENVEQYLKTIGFSEKKQKLGWWQTLWEHPLSELPKEQSKYRDIIINSRKVAILFTIGTFLLAYLFLNIWIGPIWAALAVLVISLNPLMMRMGTVATTDSMQLFFFFAALYIVSRLKKILLQKPSKSLLFYSLLLGLSFMGAVGVKVSGIIIVFVISLFYLLFIWFHHSKIKSTRISYIIAMITFLLTFIVLHPYLYRNPSRHFVELFTERLANADQYRLELPGSAVKSRTQAAKLVVSHTLLPNGSFSNYYLFGLPFDIILFVGGLVVMIKSSISALGKKKISAGLLFTVWNFVVITSLVYYLRNDWERYYLPTVICITITQVYFLKYLVQRFLSLEILQSVLTYLYSLTCATSDEFP